MESPATSIGSNTNTMMCCSSMKKRGDSFSTGDLMRTSTNNSSTSSTDQVTQINDPAVSISFPGDDYGLPQTPQRLRIDFTPNEEDTEVVQKKCSSFWEFIHSREDLRWMMVSPTPDKYPFQDENATETSTTLSPPSTTSSTKKPKSTPKEKTALSVLQFATERGAVDQALAPKICGSTCRLGSSASSDSAEDKPVPFETLKRRASIKTSSLPLAKEPKSRSKVTALGQEMDSWDKLHPKSMEPPLHPPPLSYAVLH